MLTFLLACAFIGNLYSVAADSSCSLLSSGCPHSKTIRAGDDVAISWEKLNSNDPLKFYLVPDGGNYSESDRISIDSSNGYELDRNTLRISNASSRHEGKYYCVQGSDIVRTLKGDYPSVCVVVQGNAILSRGNTETVSVANEDVLTLNTSLMFVGGGKCDVMTTVELWDNLQRYTLFELSKSNNQISTTFNDVTDEHNIILSITDVTVNSSGLYRVKVNTEYSYLEKNFTVNVQLPNTPATRTPTEGPETTTSVSTDTNPTESTTTEENSTKSTTPGASKQLPFLEKEIWFVVSGLAALFMLLIILFIIIIVIVSQRHRRRELMIKSKIRTFDKMSIYEENLFLDDFLNSQHTAHV